MAHFSRVKALGWSVDQELASADMNQLDTNVSKAVNGDDGGTWAPTDPIIFQGDGLQIDTVLNISNGASIEMLDASEINLLGASAINVSGATAAINVTGATATCTFATGTTLTCSAGSTVTFNSSPSLNAGATLASGQTLVADGATISGAKSVTGNTVLSGGNVVMTDSTCRKSFNRARVTLADADQTVDVSNGDRFDLPVNPASPRTITLDNTTVVPMGGETLTFFWYPKDAAVGGGTQYTFERGDASEIAFFKGMVSADTGLVWAEFEYVFGTGWRLGKCSGTLYDAADASYYGVVGGASS